MEIQIQNQNSQQFKVEPSAAEGLYDWESDPEFRKHSGTELQVAASTMESRQVVEDEPPGIDPEVFTPERSSKLATFFSERWQKLCDRKQSTARQDRPAAQRDSRLPFKLSPTESLGVVAYEIFTFPQIRIIGLEAIRSALQVALIKPEYQSYGVPAIDHFKSSRSFRRPGIAGGKLHELYEKADGHIRRFDAGVESPVMQRKLQQHSHHVEVAKILDQTRTRRAA